MRRTGIYFAMITVAIAEMFYFIEFNPLSDFTGGENGLPGVPTPVFNLGFTTVKFDQSLYVLLAFCYFVGLVLALRIVRSPVGAILSAIRDNPRRAAAVGHNIHSYAADNDAAAIRPQQPGQRIDHAGLAHARAAEERGDAAVRRFEPGVEREAAELFVDGDLDQSRPRRRWPTRRARISEPISAARASTTERPARRQAGRSLPGICVSV